jgi:hypothetical protein
MGHCDRSGRLGLRPVQRPGRRLGWAVLPLILLALNALSHPVSAENRTTPSGRSQDAAALEFSIVGGHARLEAEDVKLSEILKAITDRTGITAVLDREADRPVSVSIHDAGVSAALRYLLRDLNVAEMWVPAPPEWPEGGNVLSRLYIYPKGKPSPGEDPLIIAGREGKGSPDYIVESPAPDAKRPEAAKPDDASYASIAAIKAYQKKKQFKSAMVRSGAIRGDSGFSPDSPVRSTDPDQMRAYLEKKAMLKTKFGKEFGLVKP